MRVSYGRYSDADSPIASFVVDILQAIGLDSALGNQQIVDRVLSIPALARWPQLGSVDKLAFL
jgi:hypothetical protein